MTNASSTTTPAAAGAPAATAPVDPVTTEVIRYGLEAAADQMRVNLCRTAFSPGIYEISDFAAALYDRDVRLLAQARSMPSFLGTLGFCVESTVARVGGADSLREGDVLFSTYGYDTGSHQPDAAVVVPGFFRGELIGYAVVKAHNVDIGAKDPYCTDTIDIFQEGTIFPGVRVYSEGVRNEEMYRTILANSRAPAALAGDLIAQIGSARVGLRELNRLLDRFGPERFQESVERLFDHGERVVRTFLRGVPDGRFHASGAMDSNGVEPGRVPIDVRVEVEGDEICIDLSDSADQQKGPVNSPLASTIGYMRIAVATAAMATDSINEGTFRPIKVKTRSGSIFEPTPPAPIFLCGWSAIHAMELVHRALADALPEAIPAGSGADQCGVLVWGADEEGDFWMIGAAHQIGMGASARGDMTTPLMEIPISGLKSGSAEIHELSGHVVVEQLELAADSGGAGRFRGGLGLNARYRTRGEHRLMALTERTMSPAWGLNGGESARPNGLRLLMPDGTAREITKVTGIELPAGTVIEVSSGGGGGFGPPSERAPEAVHNDVREGYVTEAAARRHYPHAFNDGPTGI